MLRNYFRYFLYLYVFICFSTAISGSYEDFFMAVKGDDPAAVHELLRRGFDVNVRDPNGQHALYLAIRDQASKVTEALLVWPKTDLEARNAEGESPLMMAALKGNLELARRLIDRQADVNKPGWTPLHYASTNGHLEVMRLLLEHHAYIDAESPNGTTPLMMAAHYGTPQAVKLLLEAGADPGLRNKLELTAIDFAHRGNRPESAEIIAAFIRGRQPKGTW
jgi:ankyrin repeat protein